MTNVKKHLAWLWVRLGSLKITVAILALTTLMIFLATLDQAKYGLHHALEHYVEAWITPLPLPVPGGYLLGVVGMINLIAAHMRYFDGKKKLGITLIHVGVLLLILSSLLAGVLHSEGNLWIRQGQHGNVVESITQNELVMTRRMPDGQTQIYRIDSSALRAGAVLSGFPVPIEVLAYSPNAQIGPRDKNADLVADPSTLIVGISGKPAFSRSRLQAPQGYLRDSDWVIFQKPKTYSEDAVNAPMAIVRLAGVGEYVVSNLLGEQFMPQTATIDGVEYQIALRLQRTYLPFSLQLQKFTQEKYPGSDIPSGYSSLVVVHDRGHAPRTVLISMNEPLRYGGYTFFQASFDTATQQSSMLMVVQDHSRWLPYLAVLMITLGLLWHLITKYARFSRSA